MKYLDPGSVNFRRALNSRIYVDKSQLLEFTNRCLNTQQEYLCVSRPRRFGKTMAADMMAAYYGCGEDTRALFDGLKIAGSPSFEEHLNRYHVVKADMLYFMTCTSSMPDMLARLTEHVAGDIRERYPELSLRDPLDLSICLDDLFRHTERAVVILLDEWDCVMRREHTQGEQKQYLDFLRNLTKDQPYAALVYMTGILPVKKYGEHSALNLFCEYSMTDSAELSDCFGFTQEETAALCQQYNMDFEIAREWYDGYHLVSHAGVTEKEFSIYCPQSVVESMLRGRFDNYWNRTETVEALKKYIQLDLDGLRDAVTDILAGNPVKIDTRKFQNDMFTFSCRDDVLTLLVHLGYLDYDGPSGTVAIPNLEVADEFVRSIELIDSWGTVFQSVAASRDLLQALWDLDGDAVAAGVEKTHGEVPLPAYDDGASLRRVLGLAFYYARFYYMAVREIPACRGFAGICFVPWPDRPDKPVVVVELKWNRSAVTALEQIREKQYPRAPRGFRGTLLLCRVSYDKTTKKHTCAIESRSLPEG